VKTRRDIRPEARTGEQTAPQSVLRFCLASRCRASFTLLELLIAVLLIAIAATLVGVRLEGSTDSARLRAAAMEIQQSLKLARQESRTRHRAVDLVFSVGASRYRMTRAPDDAGTSRELHGTVIERVSIEGAAPASSDEFRIRMSVSGASLPFQLELRAGSQRRVFRFDGISGGFTEEGRRDRGDPI
jgi:type II secretory pathway pseudopilin PulG